MSKKTTVTKAAKVEKKGKVEKVQPSPKIEEKKAEPVVKSKSSPAPKKKIMSTEEIRKVLPPVGQPIPSELWEKLTLGQRAYHSWQRVLRESKKSEKAPKNEKSKASK